LLEDLHHYYLMLQPLIEQVSSKLTYLSQFHNIPLSIGDRASAVVEQFLPDLGTLKIFDHSF
jgi:hypothetical protein